MPRGSRIADITHALEEWRPERGSALSWVLPEVRDLLGAHFAGAYRPSATDDGWALDYMFGAGPTAVSHVAAFRKLVASMPRSAKFIGYDPLSVVPREQNRVILLSDLFQSEDPTQATRPWWYDALYRALGAHGQDQIRVLLCDGASVVTWIGATSQEPFRQRHVRALRRLVEPIRRRLLLERYARAPEMASAIVDAALEAIGRPAFVVGARSSIEAANAAGRVLLARDRRSVIAAIQESRKTAHGAYAITPIDMSGCPGYALAVLDDRTPSISQRIATAHRVWCLSPTQARVLEHIANGATNKEIAAHFSCAEVTIENHVTELLRRSEARSRVDLVARMFLLQGS